MTTQEAAAGYHFSLNHFSLNVRSWFISSKLVLMPEPSRPTLWQLWIQQPQKLWLRRAIFQIHLWSGIALGLYILIISVTGSVLVYSNELFRAATPAPIVSIQSGPILTDAQLKDSAVRQYPGYSPQTIFRPTNPNQAVEIWLGRNKQLKKRLFDPHTGQDVGGSVSPGIRFVSTMLDLHDNLLAGPTGRRVNAFGALFLAFSALTGMVIWWPGIKTWRRSLKVPSGLRPGRQRWARFVWHLHSMLGFWTLGFVLIFALSGFYLGNPGPFADLADWIQPPTPANSGIRFVDRVIYWVAYLHFGRINGIGIPCKGPGLCDQTIKALWAAFGLAPAAMFVTGAIMWWNRVLRPRMP